jgi:hypothetical protein
VRGFVGFELGGGIRVERVLGERRAVISARVIGDGCGHGHQ